MPAKPHESGRATGAARRIRVAPGFAAVAVALVCAVPVLAATQSTSNDNGTGGATSVSVPKPDGLAEGDFMLAAIAMKTGSSVTPTAPTAGL